MRKGDYYTLWENIMEKGENIMAKYYWKRLPAFSPFPIMFS